MMSFCGSELISGVRAGGVLRPEWGVTAEASGRLSADRLYRVAAAVAAALLLLSVV